MGGAGAKIAGGCAIRSSLEADTDQCGPPPMSYDPAMARYYFDIHNDEFTQDLEGQQFGDADLALAYGLSAARALAADSVLKGHLVLSHWIAVLDASRTPIGDVAFGAAVKVRP